MRVICRANSHYTGQSFGKKPRYKQNAQNQKIIAWRYILLMSLVSFAVVLASPQIGSLAPLPIDAVR